jgi:HMG (high mobility group) box
MHLIVKKMYSQDGLISILKDSRFVEPPQVNYVNSGSIPSSMQKRNENKYESSGRNYSMSSVDKEPLFSPPRTIMKDDMNDSRFLNEAQTADRKKRRFVEIGSVSLRNLKKEFDSKDDDPTDETKEKAVEKMNDWINRRITGYLIFQNTLNQSRIDDKTNYKELGVHLNSVAGQKWKSLPEEEKAEYKGLAKYYRRQFRDEIENYESYDDFTTLIERLDHKIKRLRKE